MTLLQQIEVIYRACRFEDAAVQVRDVELPRWNRRSITVHPFGKKAR